jgi:hypothetical protein
MDVGSTCPQWIISGVGSLGTRTTPPNGWEGGYDRVEVGRGLSDFAKQIAGDGVFFDGLPAGNQNGLIVDSLQKRFQFFQSFH